ncbi:ABC transporter permease [Microbacterium hatanonis]|jgi:ribose/xylose/arabinose/galactoside ABC-type transport system permease subunit|uniref:ABC transporter permease n=1 Tax=Microbacterium hatanonis TaxID=404366 RepID=A0A5C8HWU5_9MICO|nr:ABC transporter permease [Microbacterium hatanonis]TXK10338.1 ABC transporter permease [Microbacterium hatanonis]
MTALDSPPLRTDRPRSGFGSALGRIPTSLWVAYGLTFACLILLGVSTSDGFNPDRLLRILSNAAPLGVVAIAQTIVIINRGLDLSVGPVMNSAAILTAVLSAAPGASLATTVPLVVLMGAAIGLVNGVLLAFTRIPPLLGTLATATIIGGVNALVTRGQPRGIVPDELRVLADGRLFGTPFSASLVIWIVLLVIVGLILTGTVAGRRFKAVGANPRASWLSGVPVRRHTLVAYTASGTLAAMAGILLIAYSGSPSLTAGDSYALNSVVAAVIGGAALAGGTGGMVGTFAGVAALAFLTTVLNSFNIPSPVQFIVNGGVLIGMLLINGRLSARRGAR